MIMPKYTRRGLFQLIGAAIAGRRCQRALTGWVRQQLRVSAYRATVNETLGRALSDLDTPVLRAEDQAA